MFFFFQAEDGIRDSSVTGVQTCALPIYRCALAAHLLTEKSVVVVAAVKADVVEDAALPVNVDFVAVRALRNAHAGGQSEQVFELASENGSSGDGGLIESGGGCDFSDFDNGTVSDDDLLRD